MELLPYQYVTTPDQLADAIGFLETCNRIAVDVEGDSLFHYRDRVCLIQMTGREKNFIIDPLLIENLESLSTLFQNEKILKIFHGAEYDLLSLKRDYRFSVIHLFDTVLAARAARIKAFSLQNLVFQFFNIQLQKTHQKANWSRRPIPPEQLEYAYRDTCYLIGLHDRLLELVREKGRCDQLDEECRILEQLRWEEKEPDPESFLRLKGARDLDPGSQKILRELVQIREGLARSLDRPPFKILSNEDLLRLSSGKIRTPEDLRRLFPRAGSPVYRDSALWLKGIALGMTSDRPLPVKTRKKGTPPTPEQEKRFVELKKWRDRQATDENVEPAMVMTTEALKSLAYREIVSENDLNDSGLLRNWQLIRYRRAILEKLQISPKPSVP